MSDTTGRYMPPGDYISLKTQTKKLVNAVHGVEAAAASTRGAPVTFHRAYDNNRPDCYLGIDQVLDLEMIGGDPHVTRRLAELQGYRLVRAAPKAHAPKCPERGALVLVQAAGDYAGTVAEAAADSHYTVNEIRDMIAKAERAKEEIDANLDDLYQRLAALTAAPIVEAAE